MPPSDSLDLTERIVRLETKLDFIIAALEKSPAGPECRLKHKEFETRFSELDRWRNMLAGAFMAGNIAFIILLDKIKTWIN